MKIENENMIIFENYICDEVNLTISTKVILYSKENNDAKAKDIIIIFGDIQKKAGPVIYMDDIIIDMDRKDMPGNILDIFKSVINDGLLNIYSKNIYSEAREKMNDSINEIVDTINNFINN